MYYYKQAIDRLFWFALGMGGLDFATHVIPNEFVHWAFGPIAVLAIVLKLVGDIHQDD